MSPDARHLYVTSDEVTLALLRVPATGELKLIDEYPGAGSSLVVSPDGRSVYMGAQDRNPGYENDGIRAYNRNPATGTLTRVGVSPQPSTDRANAIAVSPDSSRVYVGRHDTNSIAIYDRALDGSLTLRSNLADISSKSHLGTYGLGVDSGGRVYADPGYSDELVVLEPTESGLAPFQAIDDCCGGSTFLFSQSEDRMYVGPYGPSVMSHAEDGRVGVIADSDLTQGAYLSGSSMALAGQSLYVPWYGGLDHVSVVGDNPVLVSRDQSAGVKNASSIIASPDGRQVYVAAGKKRSWEDVDIGRVLVFDRDHDSGALTLNSIFRGPPPRIRVTLENGATFTNDETVHLNLTGPAESMAGNVYDAANKADFSDAKRLDWGFAVEWKLAPDAVDGLPQTVYARSTNGGTGQASIILDRLSPRITRVRQKRASRRTRRVRIAVRDRVSGVSGLQFAPKRRRPGRWRKYSSRSRYLVKRRTVYVRVRDRAGNASRWRRVNALKRKLR